jgi:amino acid transporter
MNAPLQEAQTLIEDEKLLREAGYKQELARRMSAFSNFAISLSTICILAGCLTSFHVGLCSVGGASIGIGWPVGCLFALIVAATMAQVASAFPTAGGPYHWASILGGRGAGWVTACFNLAGLVTVLAAINVGTCRFVVLALSQHLEIDPGKVHPAVQTVALVLMTASQALFNHRGIRLTCRLIDLSGYLILVVGLLLTVAMLVFGLWHHGFDPIRLITFTNYSGLPKGGSPVWPASDNLPWLFALGLLLPAYTVTGFDASAHASEETIGAAHNVPRGIIQAVWVSGLAGWVMLMAIVLAIPNMDEAAGLGEQSFFHIVREVLPGWSHAVLYAGIIAAQYLCGLATLTSASRMTYAFARDGGLPFSRILRRVSPKRRSPSAAIWATGLIATVFALAIPYEANAAICAVFLYLSYVVPVTLGWWAYGRTWTRLGPWNVGRWYRLLAAASVLGCGLLIVIGMQPPNDIAVWIVGATLVVMPVLWFTYLRQHFAGPPTAILHLLRQTDRQGPP